MYSNLQNIVKANNLRKAGLLKFADRISTKMITNLV